MSDSHGLSSRSPRLAWLPAQTGIALGRKVVRFQRNGTAPDVPGFQLPDGATPPCPRGSSASAFIFCWVVSSQSAGTTHGSHVPSTSRCGSGRSSGARC